MMITQFMINTIDLIFYSFLSLTFSDSGLSIEYNANKFHNPFYHITFQNTFFLFTGFIL